MLPSHSMSIDWVHTNASELYCWIFCKSLVLHFTGPESVCVCSNFLKMCQIHWEKKVALWLTCCGAWCVSPHRPLWRHWCYPEGWNRAPSRPPAAAAAEMVVAVFNLHVHVQRCTPLNVRTTLPPVSWSRPCGTLPSGLTSPQLLFNLKTCQRDAGSRHDSTVKLFDIQLRKVEDSKLDQMLYIFAKSFECL